MKIELINIHKHYGNIRANDGITMTVFPGTVHGILGENGAGKSTLMKVLSGYTQKTAGTFLIDGKAIAYGGPAEATDMGIGMLYQDPHDFPPLSVLENFIMGQSVRNRRADSNRLSKSARHFGFQIDPEAPVRTLTVGERQQLEILRLLALGVEVLILDEPTTGITGDQKATLFNALKTLAAEGKTILLVSHKLADVEMLCDRVTVLTHGKVVGELDHPFDTAVLLEWMFGGIPSSPPSTGERTGAVKLSIRGASAPGGRAGLRDCHVQIREREVVGLAGLEGSGQGLFLRLAAGLVKPQKGTVWIEETNMTGNDHHAFNEKGVFFLPAARLEEGLIQGLTITEHFALQQGKGRVLIPWDTARKLADERIKTYRIMGRSSSMVESLSGGNQQRLLLALLSDAPRILLLEQPTRGLDVESARWVWQELMAHAEEGTTIVFSSPEIEEIMQVANRVLVFYNGLLVKDTKVRDTTVTALGRAIAGKGP
jgi:simple sugar transport system ATP-binding protein